MNNIIVQNSDADVLDFIELIDEENQTNQQKYEKVKSLFDRLHLNCDESGLRFEEDAELFSIPFDAITGVSYLEKQ